MIYTQDLQTIPYEIDGDTILAANPQVLYFYMPNDAVDIIYRFARISHARQWDSFQKQPSTKTKYNLIDKLYHWGHHSVFEHVSVSFVALCSRACTHQLVRHRIASYTQRSQRYISEKKPIIIIPPTIKPDYIPSYIQHIANNIRFYRSLSQSIPMEDARYVLPNAMASTIAVTMNFRSLMNFMWERRCTEAQWEISWIAARVSALVTRVDPLLGRYLAPKCSYLGRCPFNKTECPYYSMYVDHTNEKEKEDESRE